MQFLMVGPDEYVNLELVYFVGFKRNPQGEVTSVTIKYGDHPAKTISDAKIIQAISGIVCPPWRPHDVL